MLYQNEQVKRDQNLRIVICQKQLKNTLFHHYRQKVLLQVARTLSKSSVIVTTKDIQDHAYPPFGRSSGDAQPEACILMSLLTKTEEHSNS